jgi:benzoyl-CoA-dihydrodiol lyase
MDVDEHGAVDGHTELVLNSYDVGVDIELSDAIMRLRFEHPDVRAVIVGSGKERIFCAGANIRVLASSTHAFKVNFCKYTNETRLGMEDASGASDLKFLAAVSGTASGGGYELALACDDIVLVDDRTSAVSFPEVPLLGVLPGTGGLTRVVDKRLVRRDRADWLSTIAEGVKGQRALQWRLVDAVAKASQFDGVVQARARALADRVATDRVGPGVPLTPLDPTLGEREWAYRCVTVALDPEQRRATITVQGPGPDEAVDAAGIRTAGAAWWPLRAFRELDDAICRLRFNEPTIGTWLLETRGELADALRVDDALATLADGDWFVREVRHLVKRTLKRLDVSSRSLFALISTGSCFAGTLLELALAADRQYMLDDPDGGVAVAVHAVNDGAYPMGNGLTRLATRFLGEPGAAEALLARAGERLETPDADALGLATDAPDDLDWEDTVRVALEERASLSPDALTGMEANLRFAGPETLETKIFGRLSAWQNWIFQRDNAVGEAGALTLYGHPQRPDFDWRRT